MKKIFILVFISLICPLIFSNSLTDNKSSNFSFLKEYYNAKPELSKAETVDRNLKYVHISFAALTYASLWALDAIGIPLLYYAFTDPDSAYYDGLKYSHIGVASAALASFTTMLILGFIKMGNKLANGIPVRKSHFIAAFVTLGFYVLEVASIILSAVFFANDYDNAKWVGLGHGITCGATTMAFSVSFVTIFF